MGKQITLAWDIDGTIADFVGGFRDFLVDFQEIPLKNLPVPTVYNFHNEWGMEVDAWKNHYRDFVLSGGLRRLQTTQACRSISESLFRARKYGYRNIICTARGTEFDDIGFRKLAELDTKRWLKNKGFTHLIQDVIHCSPSKKKDIDADIYLDDSPFVLESVKLADKIPVCYTQSYNKSYKGKRVNTTREFINVVLNVLCG